MPRGRRPAPPTPSERSAATTRGGMKKSTGMYRKIKKGIKGGAKSAFSAMSSVFSSKFPGMGG